MRCSIPEVSFSMAFTWSPFGSNTDVSLNGSVIPSG